MVTTQLHNYLLVQDDRDKQRQKTWWKQPLGMALIVLLAAIGWELAKKKVLGW